MQLSRLRWTLRTGAGRSAVRRKRLDAAGGANRRIRVHPRLAECLAEFASATDATEWCGTTRLCDSPADFDRGGCGPWGDREFHRDILPREPAAGLFRFHRPEPGNGLLPR